MRIVPKLFYVSFMLCVLGGCGGGGGSSAGTGTVIAQSVVSASKVSVALSTSGVSTGIYGVQCKFNLPPGVTLASDANGEVSAGVISLTGGSAGKTVASNYTKTAIPATVRISLVRDTATTSGEFMIVQFDVAAGTVIRSSDLIFSEFKAYDGNGAVIPGVVGVATIK